MKQVHDAAGREMAGHVASVEAVLSGGMIDCRLVVRWGPSDRPRLTRPPVLMVDCGGERRQFRALAALPVRRGADEDGLRVRFAVPSELAQQLAQGATVELDELSVPLPGPAPRSGEASISEAGTSEWSFDDALRELTDPIGCLASENAVLEQAGRAEARSEAYLAYVSVAAPPLAAAWLVLSAAGPLDIVGRDAEGRFVLLLAETTREDVQRRLDALAQRIARHGIGPGRDGVQLTPTIGFAPCETPIREARRRALCALEHATSQLDLRSVYYREDLQEALRREAPQATSEPAKRSEPVRIALPSAGIGTWRWRIAVLVGVAVAWGAIYWLQTALWNLGRAPAGAVETVISWISLIWVLPILPAGLGLVGYLRYRRPQAGAVGLYQPLDNLVSFRIVSRGQNAAALRNTVESVRREMRRAPVFEYVIEVITDLPVDLHDGPDLVHFLVPADYETPRRSLFKARALQYAVEVSDLPDDAWIMHLDEESWISPSLLAGMHRAIREEEASGEHRIGQGAILYHRDIAAHPFLTLADMIRSGDDLGRFRLQHEIGITMFGLHGSFVLARQSVVGEVGFDFGPEGSITEDAFWALVQMERGRRCRWIEGYVEEQPTQSAKDFMKQRRRWFIGLVKVVQHAPVALRWRVPLAISVGLWSLSWVGVLYTYVRLGVGLQTPAPWIVWVGDLAFSIYVANYVLGLKLNLDDWEPVGKLRAAGLYVAVVLLIPIFSLLEVGGVLWALLRPDPGFHVVKK